MSGEDYVWVHVMASEDVLAQEAGVRETLADMEADGRAAGAVRAVGDALDAMKAAAEAMDHALDTYGPVFRAFNWWKSCDSSEASFVAVAMAAPPYREPAQCVSWHPTGPVTDEEAASA